MKLLFAANRFPYPPFRGDKLKIYNLAKRLCQKHELHLITFIEDEADRKYLKELTTIFTKIVLVPLPKLKAYRSTFQSLMTNLPLQVGYFKHDAMDKAIDELCSAHTYDAVHVQHLRLAQYWYQRKEIPRILDLPDAYSLYWKRRKDSSSGLKKIFNQIEYKRVHAYEQILNEFEYTLACSQEDLAYLKNTQRINNVHLLPNGVNCSAFAFPDNKYTLEHNILFTGNMDYAPNVDAVQYFVKEILPLIKEKVPQVHFTIAGQRPVDKVKALATDTVSVTGFVPDLKEMYHQATLVVAPLRFGAGTQNKVLEAMAAGIPVVSRNIGFNGLNIRSGEGVILAMETEDFANQCITLLQNKEKRQQVGQKGAAVVNQYFDWDAIATQLENYFNQVIQIHKS